jgi:uncharacterized membrane protein YadS
MTGDLHVTGAAVPVVAAVTATGAVQDPTKEKAAAEVKALRVRKSSVSGK